MTEFKGKKELEYKFHVMVSLYQMFGSVGYYEVVDHIKEWESYLYWGSKNNMGKTEKRRVNKILNYLYEMRKVEERELLNNK